jgi:flagellar basal body-associated protein FliL
LGEPNALGSRLLFANSTASVFAFEFLKSVEIVMSPTPPETPAAKTDAAAEAAPKKSKFGGKKVKIALIVLAVMGLQAVAAALLLPKSQATPAGGQAAEAGHGKEEGHAEKTEKEDNLVEAEIGQFSVSLEENNGILWNVSFKLFAAVAPSAKNEFSDAVGERFKARIKQAVVKVVRRSSIEDMRDAQLDLFKRNLKTEINNVLPERYVQEMIIADIRLMQQ